MYTKTTIPTMPHVKIEFENTTFFSKIGNIERECFVVKVALKALAFIAYFCTVFLPIHDLYVTLKNRISLGIIESKMKDFQKRIVETARLEDPKTIAYALKRIAFEQAVLGDEFGAKNTFFIEEAKKTFEVAKAAAATITDPFWKAEALKDIAEAQAKALRRIAKAQAESGDIDEAKAIAATITDPFYKAYALRDIAEAQAEAGDIDGAKATAETILEPDFKAQALREIAKAQAESGDIDEAKETAATITNTFWKESALEDIAIAQAESGDIDEAKATAATITDPRIKASALRGITIAQRYGKKTRI